MRGNVNQDAAKLFAHKEPRRAAFIARTMWPQPDCIDDFPDCPTADHFGGESRSTVLEALAIVNGVNALRLGLNLARCCQLLQRSKTGLVTQIVLAMLHHPHTQ